MTWLPIWSRDRRLLWWPIRIRFRRRRLKPLHDGGLVSHHGWELGTERCDCGCAEPGQAHPGMMPGRRRVLGHAFWIGPIGIIFAPRILRPAWLAEEDDALQVERALEKLDL